MSPFKDPVSGGGWYKPESGMKVGEFLGIEDGPTQTYDGKETPQMRWSWKVYEMDKTTPVMYVPLNQDGTPTGDPPTHAIVDALSSEATGPKSKARKWLIALLDRPVDPKSAAEFLALLDEAKQKAVKSFLVFGPSERDATKIVVQNIVPIK